MAAALECWSGRADAEEDVVEQVLMRDQNRSEAPQLSTSSSTKDPSSAIHKRFQRLSRNVSDVIASIKHSLSLDTPTRDSQSDTCRKVVWARIVRNLTQLYSGSHLPEKLISNIRKHYDSLPLSYAQACFDVEDVFLHLRLIEQASLGYLPAISIQEVSSDEVQGSVFRLTFVCNSSISWPAMSGALDNASICCRKIQIFERKGFTLGVVVLLVQSGQEKSFTSRIENALKASAKKSKPAAMKIPFGFCGCQEENTKGREIGVTGEDCREQNKNGLFENSNPNPQLQSGSSYVVSVDEWQTIQSGRDDIVKWVLISDSLDFIDQIGPNTFKGVYKGKRVGIEKLKGCEKGKSYEFEVHKDVMEVMTCGHITILQFYGVCIDESHGLCVVTKMMEGGSVHELIVRSKRLETREIMRIAADVAEGMKFMNDRGFAYRDLNTRRILLDRQGNACLGDMGIVTVCRSFNDAVEYETDGYRWLAPEIIAGDPENVAETWMSNVYSLGMVIWEMVTGEAAFASLSPVQAAVGIAACGLRPEIPTDCPQILTSLMNKCWNNCPSKRPQLSEILLMLTPPGNCSPQ